MQVVREIKTVRNKRVSVDVPASFKNKRVEILIFPVEEESSKSITFEHFIRFVKANTVRLPVSYRFDRDELHER